MSIWSLTLSCFILVDSNHIEVKGLYLGVSEQNRRTLMNTDETMVTNTPTRIFPKVTLTWTIASSLSGPDQFKLTSNEHIVCVGFAKDKHKNWSDERNTAIVQWNLQVLDSQYQNVKLRMFYWANVLLCMDLAYQLVCPTAIQNSCFELRKK